MSAPAPQSSGSAAPGLSRTRTLIGLAGWLLLSFAAAAVGAVASVHAREFYAGLVRPSWAPPGWVFGPVWSVLYTCMGIAAWLVWKDAGFASVRKALGLFIAQFVINALWSWLFFAWHRGAWAFADIVVLWILIAWTALEFSRRRISAGVLLLPYLGWVTFATALCFSTWRLNPSQL